MVKDLRKRKILHEKNLELYMARLDDCFGSCTYHPSWNPGFAAFN